MNKINSFNSIAFLLIVIFSCNSNFNENEVLIQSANSWENWNLKNKVESIYQSEYYSDTIEHTKFTFNRNGYMMTEDQYDQNKELVISKRYYYDRNGYVTQIVGDKPNGDTVRYIFNYDEKYSAVNALINFDNIIEHTIYNTVYDQYGKDSISVFFKQKRNIIDSIHYIYDSMGNLKSEISFIPDYRILQYQQLSKELTRLTIINDDSTVVETQNLAYSFDFNGNWISKLSTNSRKDTLILIKRDYSYFK